MSRSQICSEDGFKFAVRVVLNEIIGIEELVLRMPLINVHFLLPPTTMF